MQLCDQTRGVNVVGMTCSRYISLTVFILKDSLAQRHNAIRLIVWNSDFVIRTQKTIENLISTIKIVVS